MAKKRLIERLQPLLVGVQFYVDEHTKYSADRIFRVYYTLFYFDSSGNLKLVCFPNSEGAGQHQPMSGLLEDEAFEYFKSVIESER